MTLADPELPARFHDLLQRGYRQADVEGVFQVHLRDAEHADFHVQLGGDAVRLTSGVHARPTVTITLASSLLSTIVAQPHVFDARDPEIRANIALRGDVSFAIFISELIKTPAPDSERIFADAERIAVTQALPSRIAQERDPSERTVVEHLGRGLPLIASGSLARSGGAWAWDPRRLIQQCGEVPLRVNPTTGKAESVGQFIEALITGAPCSYISGAPLPPMLRRCFPMPYFGADAFHTGMIWAGESSSATPCTSLHRDTSHGLLGQWLGSKRVLLFSPRDAACLYPRRAYNVYQPCWVKPWAPDLEKFPLFARATPFEVTLKPGELLIIPAGWFHCVWGLEPVFSVSSFMNWSAWQRVRASEVGHS